MRTFLSILLLLAGLNARAVQPPTEGRFEMAWEKVLTNDVVDYVVWETTNGAVKWKPIGNTRTNWFTWTNRNITPLTFYRVTQIPWMPSGSQDVRHETEIGLLHWAPSGTNVVTNATSYVRLASVDVPVNQRVKVSSDLKVFEDAYTFRVLVGTNEVTNALVRLQHMTSPLRPKFFTVYPEPVMPPPLP